MHTFKKNERLGNYRLRQLLFERGRRFFHYPFRVFYLCFPRDELSIRFFGEGMPPSARFHYPVKALVGTSRRNFAGATQRNRVKRVVKEAYRKNKKDVYSFLNKKQARCLLGFIYVGREMPEYSDMMLLMPDLLASILQRIDKEGLDHIDGPRQKGGK